MTRPIPTRGRAVLDWVGASAGTAGAIPWSARAARSAALRVIGLLALVGTLAGCPGRMPETHHYALRLPAPAEAAEGTAVLAVEPLEVAAGYDDDRIVYRLSPYRLDYYEYHRWSAPPASHVTDYLRDAYARSGRFARVLRQPSGDARVVLGGRLSRFEEVDVTETEWTGRIDLELWLLDLETGAMLRSWHFLEEEPLEERSPEGLARALSVALERVVRATAADIAAAVEAVVERRSSRPPSP